MADKFDDILSQLHDKATLEDKQPDGTDSPVITINEKREFDIPPNYNTVIAYAGDVNSQIVTFEIPRYQDGHDLGACAYKKLVWKNLTSDYEGASDLKINVETNKLKGSWEVPAAAFTHAGQLEIAISIYDISGGKIAYSWNTTSSTAFSVGSTLSDLDYSGQDFYIPAKDEILYINENRQITMPNGYNPIIANYGDIGISKTYFRVKRNIAGIDVLDDNTSISVLINFNDCTTSETIASGQRKIFVESVGDEYVILEWNVSRAVTNNDEFYFGPITIGLSFSNTTLKWSTLPFSGLLINEALVEGDETREERIPFLTQTLSGNEEDKAPSVKAVVKALEKIGQLKPEFANSIEECVDTTKLYVLPDGFIYAYMVSETEVNYNVFDSSAALLNYRLKSSGDQVEFPGGYVTDYLSINTSECNTFVFRITPFNNTVNNNGVHFYDAAKTWLGMAYLPTNGNWGEYADDTKTIVADFFQNKSGISADTIRSAKYIRITLNTGITSGINQSDIDDISIIFDNNKTTEVVYQWTNTGHAFIPADYEDRIVELEKETTNHETRLLTLEQNDALTANVPAYWLNHLAVKADQIQAVMESAGRNKSAFLWYTDAHWPYNSKISPALLKYLQKNTPINKVNFGGDIVGDPSPFEHDKVKYVYEWRKLLAGISNHHSVYGNHDVHHRTTDVGKIAYSLLLAPEETPDMVVGGDSYYYIDCPAEKTRYLYLSFFTNNTTDQIAQGQFIIDAISGVNEGWHIVAIAHRWWNYSAVSTPTEGYVPDYESEILRIFDEYNARETHSTSTYFNEQNFATAKGKVEFCIGGHIHVDFDFDSADGIPIIITAADANQERAPEEDEDSGDIGTITESAIYGIIADYDNKKITVVGVGRGTSREIDIKI